MARVLCAAGAATIQLRLKDWPDAELVRCAQQVAAICRGAKVPLIINDRADLAVLVDAAGVHVGAGDLPIGEARAIVGSERWVGFSTHSVEEVIAARAAGADYVGFGPVYKSVTKAGVHAPRGLTGLSEAVAAAGSVPVVAIGGLVDRQRVRAVRREGAHGAAVLSAVSGAVDMGYAAALLVAAAKGDMP